MYYSIKLNPTLFIPYHPSPTPPPLLLTIQEYFSYHVYTFNDNAYGIFCDALDALFTCVYGMKYKNLKLFLF